VAAYFSTLELFQGIFDLAKNSLSTQEVNKLLSVTDNTGITVFHMAPVLSKVEVFQEIFNLLKCSNNIGG
jgi:aspartate carbamoyltransferase regulatory subunit